MDELIEISDADDSTPLVSSLTNSPQSESSSEDDVIVIAKEHGFITGHHDTFVFLMDVMKFLHILLFIVFSLACVVVGFLGITGKIDGCEDVHIDLYSGLLTFVIGIWVPQPNFTWATTGKTKEEEEDNSK